MLQKFDEGAQHISKTKLDNQRAISWVNMSILMVTLISPMERLDDLPISCTVAKAQEYEVLAQCLHRRTSEGKGLHFRRILVTLDRPPQKIFQRRFGFCLQSGKSGFSIAECFASRSV